MYRFVLIIAFLTPFMTGCIRQAERQEANVDRRLTEEQQQINKVEKQIKDLKEATAY